MLALYSLLWLDVQNLRPKSSYLTHLHHGNNKLFHISDKSDEHVVPIFLTVVLPKPLRDMNTAYQNPLSQK